MKDDDDEKGVKWQGEKKCNKRKKNRVKVYIFLLRIFLSLNHP